MNVFFYIWPFWASPSSAFCDIETGALFKDSNTTWRLLSRDAVRVRVVHWNAWTRLWWGR
jgi:hypothetical protein